MKILISGSTGFIGSHLCSFLSQQGYEVTRLVRNKQPLEKNSIYWNPDRQELCKKDIEGFDCIIHLAGENIASKRWTEKQKSKIYHSRIQYTTFLVDSITKLQSKPKTFLCASASGFYGNRSKEILVESSSQGKGFLADVCSAWEQACLPAKAAGIRVVNLRFGMILGAKGGALAKMVLPFKLGFGGRIGNGRQYMSWITLDDTVSAIDFIIKNSKIDGAVNIVSPNPVTNIEFTKALGTALHRPTIIPLPETIVKMVLGEMADELLLYSSRIVPGKLLNNGFSFKHESISDAFRAMIK